MAEPSESPFELAPGSFQFTLSSSHAGAHADWTTKFDFAHDPTGHTFNDVRNVNVQLPTGFDASNVSVPTCTLGQLATVKTLENPGGPSCPPASQIGTIKFDAHLPRGTGGEEEVTLPVFNVQSTSTGVAAEIGFNVFGDVIQVLPVTVRPGDLGIDVATPNIEKITEPRNISVTIWGLPAGSEHDAERGLECRATLGGAEPLCFTNIAGTLAPQVTPVPANVPVKPFLSNPTSCGVFIASMQADSWEHPEEWTHAESTVGPIDECNRVPFEPSVELQPSTRSAESPTGLAVSLVVPQTWENPSSLSTSNLKDVRVTLPQGMTINPSAGAGLASCTVAQYEAETASSPADAGCPAESRIGSITIDTPLLSEPIPPLGEGSGSVYIAKPYENPFGSLLALYVVAKDPQKGIVVKVAGKVEPDPLTGQLVTTFQSNPQQPFSRFTLKFRPGATAPLVSPPVCGTFTSEAELTPWSAPLEPHLVGSSFPISQGVREGPCPSAGTPPFQPQPVAGTQNNAAGAYSPFYLRLAREDGEQEITGFSTIMPPGLTGNLTGIPFCPDAAIEAARAHTGDQQLAEPSCPAASKLGHTITEAGVGSVLAQTPGSLYLGGPFRGAPFSLVSVTSATVGPFDLGTVVIRFALHINPITAQVEVSPTGSEPIPHIIKGIVTHVRNIRAYIDRPNFIINPTSCEPMSIANTITGAGADPSNPADQVPVNVSSRFQAADCQSLQFKPGFAASTSAKTSRVDGASLRVTLTYPNAPQGTQANIRYTKVELPRQLPSRLTTLQKACLASVFEANPANCPSQSVVGMAKAVTPILPVPLTGPAYFVSYGNAKFPELVVVLQGYGVTVYLHGETFISKTGVTSSTFKSVPDVPVSSFELTLPQGPFSALAANASLCTTTSTVKKKVKVRVHGHTRTVTRKVKKTVPLNLTMPTSFIAQNGMTMNQNTKIAVTGCPKVAPGHKAKKASRSRRRRKH